jgi:hypothetical protein
MKPPVLRGNLKLFLSLAQFVYISTITIPNNIGGTPPMACELSPIFPTGRVIDLKSE